MADHKYNGIYTKNKHRHCLIIIEAKGCKIQHNVERSKNIDELYT